MPDVSETVTEAVERDRESHSHLNSAVAILVALTATFMALCNVKDGNVTQAMTQAQAQAVDTWSYYQSKSIKGHLAEQTVDQLRIQRALAPPALLPMLDAKIAEYAKQAQKENSEKKKIQAQAEGYQKEYDHLNFRDDQFDMSDRLHALRRVDGTGGILRVGHSPGRVREVPFVGRRIEIRPTSCGAGFNPRWPESPAPPCVRSPAPRRRGCLRRRPNRPRGRALSPA